jgi:hypothetical protein
MIIFVRNLVVNDFWLKLFSLALAILIWLTVDFSINKEVSPWSAIIGRTSDETVLTVPVQAPSVGGRVMTMNPAVVQVFLRGDPKLIKGLRPDDVRAEVESTGVDSGDGVRPVNVILPPGVAYTRITPEEVDVRALPETE